MNFKPLALLIIILFVTAGVYADAENQKTANYAGIYYGLGYFARQDFLATPWVHQNVTFVNAASEFNRSGKLVQTAKISFTTGRQGQFEPFVYYNYPDSTEFTTDPHSFFFAELDYGLGPVFRLGEQWSLSIGGMLDNSFQVNAYVFGQQGSEAYYVSLALAPWVTGSFQITESATIRAELQVPLFAWVARSPYLLNTSESIENSISHNDAITFLNYIADGSLQTVNSFQAADVSIAYTQDFGKHWYLTGKYQLQFLHSAVPDQLLSYKHTLFIGGGLRF